MVLIKKQLRISIVVVMSLFLFLMHLEPLGELHTVENFAVSLGSYIPINDSIIETVQRNQQERIHRVREVCNYSQDKPVTAEDIKDILNNTNVVVDDKHNTLYCYLPKVACTSWKVKLVHATGRARGQVLNTHPSVVDERAGLAKFGLYMLNDYSPDQIKYRINNYYKFVFVRNPMERLLSAYRSKWEVRPDNAYDRKYFYKMYYPEIVDTVRLNKSDRTSMVTFEEFVNYLIYKSNRQETMETHWERYYKQCHICNIDYDFIGKFDTLIEDISFVLRQILPNENDYFFPNVSQPRSALKLVNKYYGQLDQSLIDKLLKAYKRDMKLFGYEFEIHR